MLPENRLEEAIKQIRLARESNFLTEDEDQLLDCAEKDVVASKSSIIPRREESDGAEVVDGDP